VTSLNSLYELLRPLRLYALGRGSLIDAELAAYGAGFEPVDAALEELRGAAHPKLAHGPALDLHEEAVGLPIRAGVDDEARRELILRRLAWPFPTTRAGTEEALAGCGLIDPHIEEAPGALFISAAGIVPGMTADQCWELALRVMPAHLPVFTKGPTWDEWDSAAKTWDERDGLGRSWVEMGLLRM